MQHYAVAVIGAGFAGVTLAIKLAEAGIDDIVVLERGDDVGGVWRENTYPGCACDVPSALYSLSFAPNPNWSRTYATQPEILQYIQGVARDHGLDRVIRFQHEVTAARWVDDAQHWAVETNRGELTCDVLVGAAGPFGDPKLPTIPGRDAFAGTTFHSAMWNHDHDLRGERVAVIGTGASAIQFVPEIQPLVQKLTVFQRTPSWVLPRLDLQAPPAQRALFRRLPVTQRAMRGLVYATIECLGFVGFVDVRFRYLYERAGHHQLRRQVPDPELRARLTPGYMLGCNRTVLADRYFPALSAPNAAVVSEGITRITPHGIVTNDGREHEIDTIIWATGFDVPSRRLNAIVGEAGEALAERWTRDRSSYLGTTTTGFPNLFTVLGPFSAGGNQSALYMMESQVRYIVDAVTTMRRERIGVVRVRPEAEAAFTDEVYARSRGTVWETGGCASYYTDGSGRNGGLWPNWSFVYRRRTRRFDLERYETEPTHERVHVAA